jgi:hypothetical protein
MGITPLDLGPQDAVSDDRGRGHVAYEIPVDVSAAGTVKIHKGPSERRLRVKGVHGVMTAAGGTSVQVQDLAGNAISDAIDVSALADKAVFSASTIDDTYWDIDPHAGEGLQVVVVGAVSARVYVQCEPRP